MTGDGGARGLRMVGSQHGSREKLLLKEWVRSLTQGSVDITWSFVTGHRSFVDFGRAGSVPRGAVGKSCGVK